MLFTVRVRKAIEQCAQVASAGGGCHDYQSALREQEKRAVSIVYGMSSAVSKTLLRWGGGVVCLHLCVCGVCVCVLCVCVYFKVMVSPYS